MIQRRIDILIACVASMISIALVFAMLWAVTGLEHYRQDSFVIILLVVPVTVGIAQVWRK